jgi:copper oxidase (laccase) domain-containing protein
VGEPLAAWVGPCIHACCYVVGDDVTSAFEGRGLPIAGAGRVDPAAAAADALRRAGVAAVCIATECTSCDPRYFSYRREGVTGRQAAIVGLTSPA